MNTTNENSIRVESNEYVTTYHRDDNCERHGPFESTACIPGDYDPERKPTHWIGCQNCREEREAEKKRQQREEEMRERLDARIAGCGIPHRFRDASLANYLATNAGQRHALDLAKDYAADFRATFESGQSMLLLGNMGTGKSHIAVGIARAAMEQGARAIFTTVADMIGSVKATWGQRGSVSEAEVIERFATVNLLVLDEVGSIKCSGREREILFAILNGRHNEVLPTVFTANLKPDELPSYIGDQIVSRLRESGSQSVVFNWGDYRPIKGKQAMEERSVTSD